MAPSITNIVPAAGPLAASAADARFTPVSFNVVMDAGTDLPVVWVTWGDPTYDTWLVYDGAAFTPAFLEHCSVVDNGGGDYDFSLLPNGGWLSGFDLTIGVATAPVSNGDLEWTLPPASDISPPKLSEADEVLGRDIMFQDGSTQITPSGDYALVNGELNLRQSLLHRILIAEEEWRIKSDYGAGLGAFVQEALTQAARDELKSLITEQCMRDRRVLKVSEISLEVDYSREVLKVLLVVESRSGTVTLQEEIR